MSVIQDLLVDPSFLELDRQLNAFNIFDVLNVREYEIRHTRFLAHLLDPCGTHGLGSTFLRSFLLQVSAQVASDERVGLLDEVHKLDLELARVMAEISLTTNMQDEAVEISDEKPGNKRKSSGQGRLDILLQIPRRGQADIAIAIENKINARESNGQLERYKDWVTNRFNDNVVLLYLTVNEEEVDSAWNSITYSNVVYPALNLTQQSCSTVGPGPALMISHYMSVLHEKVEAEAANADADSIAQELHQNYPAAKATIDALQDEWKGAIDGRELNSNWGLYNRYKAAFKFLSLYHRDELSKTLKWFTSTWPKQVAESAPDAPHIVIDDSNRSYMRFLPVPPGSRLKELSHKYAQKAGANGKYAWTSGQYGVLFEVRCYSMPYSVGGKSNGENEYGWNLFLVIGPMEGIDRTAFITHLRSLLSAAFPRSSSNKDSDFVPSVRQVKISPIFCSTLKWKLPARDVAGLEKDLASPLLLASIGQVARLVEQALSESEATI
jgi:hypothetical protein